MNFADLVEAQPLYVGLNMLANFLAEFSVLAMLPSGNVVLAHIINISRSPV